MRFRDLLHRYFGPPARKPGPDQREAHDTLMAALCEAASSRRAGRYAAARAYLGIARRSQLFLASTVNVLP